MKYVNQYYVLWFDIPVQNFVFVHKLNGVEEVADDERSGFFWKGGAVRDDIEELSIRS